MGIVKDILYKVSNKKLLPRFRSQTIFPCYHIVKDDKVEHIENLYEYKNQEQFLNDLKVFESHYQPMEPGEILKSRHSKNRFLLTFDDGLHEVYTVIYPILKSRNIRAIFFINPNFIDNEEGLYRHYISIIIAHLEKNNFKSSMLEKISEYFAITYTSPKDFVKKIKKIRYSERNQLHKALELLNIDIKKYLKHKKLYMTKEQIQEMINDGYYFGAHTMNHPPLNQLTFAEQKEEIIQSIQWLKNNFSLDYSFFAFPFSDKPASKKLIEELFKYNSEIILFGNSGLRKDIDDRIIQRFSMEDPKKDAAKQIITENFYKYYNMIIGKYNLRRR